MMHYVALCTVLSLAAAASQSHVWNHGWETPGSLLYGHGTGPDVLTADMGLNFLADNFQIVTFGDCYGVPNGRKDPTPMESLASEGAATIKARNPDVRTIYYFKTDFSSQMEKCSTAEVKATWDAHPEWKLLDDAGNPVPGASGRYNVFNWLDGDFRAFWVNHTMSICGEKLGSGEKYVFDGIFGDGGFVDNIRGIAEPRLTQLHNAHAQMVGELQAALDTRGAGQLVIWNAMDTEAALDASATTAGGNMVDHYAGLQFVNDDTGELLPEAMEDLMFNVIGSPKNANRTLEIKLWPGPLIHPKTWVHNSQPNTTAGVRAAMAEFFNPALAYYLAVAEANMWFGYSWFWLMSDVIPFGANHTVPDAFYPELKCALGAPLGPLTNGTAPHTFDRVFEHAKVHVDLLNRTATRVVFAEPCPSA